MFNVLLVFHCMLCVFLVVLVLMQQGKGADLGATLSGGSNSVFGAAGAADMLTKLTTGTAVAFMLTSILLVRSYNSAGGLTTSSDIMEGSLFSEADEVAVTTEKKAVDFENLPTGEETTKSEGEAVAAPDVAEKAAESETAAEQVEAAQVVESEPAAAAAADTETSEVEGSDGVEMTEEAKDKVPQ